tara:strand:+ start:1961 stop:3247 length:1287 start_codon:yes stop_codon:yes gene_type:complete
MNNLFKINGNPEQYEDLDVFHKLAQQFLPYAQQSLGFDKPVGVNLLSDPENVKDPLGKTAYYDPNKMEITLFVDKRHVKDVLRSMSHELVHHTQNCRGEFDGGVHTGPGYAQEDEHMRKMEAEAYLKGQMTLRDFEDNLKENKTMSKKRLKEQAAKPAVNQLDPNDPGYTGEFNVDYKDPVTMPQIQAPTKQRKRAGGSLERLIRGAAQDALKQGQGAEGIGQMVVDLLVKAGVNLDPRRNLLDPKTSDPDTKEMQKLVNKKQMAQAMARADKRVRADRGDVAGGQADEARFEEGVEPVEEVKMVDNPKGDGKVPFYAADGKGSGDLAEESVDEGEGALCPKCKKRHPVKEMCGDPAKHENLQEEEASKEKKKEETPEEKKEETPEEKKARLTKSVKKKTFLGAMEENWTKKNKDQLLFERLIEKWIK